MRLTAATLVTALHTTAVLASYSPSSTSDWTTLTPTGTISGAQTDYPTSFGIAVVPVAKATKASTTTAAASSDTYAAAKRDVSTIIEPVSQIADGQIQATTTSSAISTYTSDDEIVTQYMTETEDVTNLNTVTATESVQTTECDVCTTHYTVFTLSGDTSSSIDDDSTFVTTTSCESATTFTTEVSGVSYVVVSSLSDCAASTTSSSDSQLSTSTLTLTASASTTDESDIIASTTSSEYESSSTSTATATVNGTIVDSGSYSCKKAGTLTMTLSNSILKDSSNRVGSIVANRQFQFDGPTPQAGAIYAAGWSITSEGYLAIGETSVFYQCLSGTFYNLYDESIGDQCSPVYLEIVNLIDC